MKETRSVGPGNSANTGETEAGECKFKNKTK